jgi:hypothetical protein
VESGSGGGSRLVRASAAVATMVAAIVLFAVFRQTVDLPGASQEPSASAGPSESAPPSNEPSPNPTEPAAGKFLAPGDMGYLVLSGGGFADHRLVFVNARTDAEVVADVAPSGAVVASALSPDGRWLAYITVLGETGANEVWALSLTDGSTHQLGCPVPAVFSDRLAWSPDSLRLAYTLVAFDGASELGGVGCQLTEPGAAGASDAWVFDTGELRSSQWTPSGDVYVASSIVSPATRTSPSASLVSGALWVSHLFESPSSSVIAANASDWFGEGQADGVFLPTANSADSATLFYRPVFVREGADWSLQGGGIPLIGSVTSAGISPVFEGTEAIDPGTAGSSLVEWQVGWSADDETFVVWATNWNVIFVGHASIPGAEDSQEVTVDKPVDGAWIVAAVLSPDASVLTVTMGIPSAGIGDPPTSLNLQVDLDTGSVAPGCCTEPVWVGPAVFGR